MKKIVLMLLAVLLCFILLGCEKEPVKTDLPKIEETVTPSEIAQIKAIDFPIPMEITLPFRPVLQGRKPFYLNGRNNEIYITDYVFSGSDVGFVSSEVLKYAYIDMDNNGTDELLIQNEFEDTLMLCDKGEYILGIDFAFADMNFIRTDGAFEWSNTNWKNNKHLGTCSGKGKLEITDYGYKQSNFYSKTELYMPSKTLCYVLGEEVTENEYFSALRNNFGDSESKYLTFSELYHANDFNESTCSAQPKVAVKTDENAPVIEEPFLSVINNEKMLYTINLSKETTQMYFSELVNLSYGTTFYESASMGYLEYAFVDMNNDGKSELVVREKGDSLFVFYNDGEDVYCQENICESEYHIKTDGTLEWIFANTYGAYSIRLAFEIVNNEMWAYERCSTFKEHYSDPETKYYIDKKEVSEQEYNEYESQFSDEAVAFYPMGYTGQIIIK